jgi:arylsulfatase A
VGELRGTKGSNFEGGIRVPGIFSWPGKIPERQITDEPAGLIDILPTVCGLLGIDPPKGVPLDGADLSPILLGEDDSITRRQPLAWILPLSGSPLALRDGNWSLIGYRTEEFPRDSEAMNKLLLEIEVALRESGVSDPEAVVKAKLFEGFDDPEAERLRGAYIRHNQFQESWIPAIKTMTYDRFELFDLSEDLAQQHNVAAQHPEIFQRLKKQLLELTANVVAEGPNWRQQQE